MRKLTCISKRAVYTVQPRFEDPVLYLYTSMHCRLTRIEKTIFTFLANACLALSDNVIESDPKTFFKTTFTRKKIGKASILRSLKTRRHTLVCCLRLRRSETQCSSGNIRTKSGQACYTPLRGQGNRHIGYPWYLGFRFSNNALS